jgi:hypothetical protein
MSQSRQVICHLSFFLLMNDEMWLITVFAHKSN